MELVELSRVLMGGWWEGRVVPCEEVPGGGFAQKQKTPGPDLRRNVLTPSLGRGQVGDLA